MTQKAYLHLDHETLRNSRQILLRGGREASEADDTARLQAAAQHLADLPSGGVLCTG